MENDAQCIECSAGEFSSTAGSSCTSCGIGNFSASQGSQMCDICAAGRYTDAEGASECMPCAGGTYSEAGADSCSACPAGTISSLSSASPECSACEAGQYSPGTDADSETLSCTDCSAGSYADADGASECMPCSAGNYSDADGAAGCTPCAEQTISGDPGASSCDACEAGFYSGLGEAECIDCSLIDDAHVDAAHSCTNADDSQLSHEDGVSDSLCAEGHHHLDGDPQEGVADDCVMNECSCENGSGAFGTDCPSDDGSHAMMLCASCESGYVLDSSPSCAATTADGAVASAGEAAACEAVTALDDDAACSAATNCEYTNAATECTRCAGGFSVAGDADCTPCTAVEGAADDVQYTCTTAEDTQFFVSGDSDAPPLCAVGFTSVDNPDAADVCEPNVCTCENGDGSVGPRDADAFHTTAGCAVVGDAVCAACDVGYILDIVTSCEAGYLDEAEASCAATTADGAVASAGEATACEAVTALDDDAACSATTNCEYTAGVAADTCPGAITTSYSCVLLTCDDRDPCPIGWYETEDCDLEGEGRICSECERPSTAAPPCVNSTSGLPLDGVIHVVQPPSCAGTDDASANEATACEAVTALDDDTACSAATNCAYTAEVAADTKTECDTECAVQGMSDCWSKLVFTCDSEGPQPALMPVLATFRLGGDPPARGTQAELDLKAAFATDMALVISNTIATSRADGLCSNQPNNEDCVDEPRTTPNIKADQITKISFSEGSIIVSYTLLIPALAGDFSEVSSTLAVVRVRAAAGDVSMPSVLDVDARASPLPTQPALPALPDLPAPCANRGFRLSDDQTTCVSIQCGDDWHVDDHQCVQCTPGQKAPYGTEAAYEDTPCYDPCQILLPENGHWGTCELPVDGAAFSSLEHGQRCKVGCLDEFILDESAVPCHATNPPAKGPGMRQPDGGCRNSRRYSVPYHPRCWKGVLDYDVRCVPESPAWGVAIILIIIIIIPALVAAGYYLKAWGAYKTEIEAGNTWDAKGQKIDSNGNVIEEDAPPSKIKSAAPTEEETDNPLKGNKPIDVTELET